jgi:hypothetical protein
LLAAFTELSLGIVVRAVQGDYLAGKDDISDREGRGWIVLAASGVLLHVGHVGFGYLCDLKAALTGFRGRLRTLSKVETMKRALPKAG